MESSHRLETEVRRGACSIGKKNEDVMAATRRATLLREVIDHPEGVEMSEPGPGDGQRFGERFDPFHDPYLSDPYPFFAEVRAATSVFHSPDLDYWVVTRYHDIEQIFRTPQVFSAANTLAPLQPICPAAGRLLAEGGFRPVPSLTNSDPQRTPECGGSRTSPSPRDVSPPWKRSSGNSPDDTSRERLSSGRARSRGG